MYSTPTGRVKSGTAYSEHGALSSVRGRRRLVKRIVSASATNCWSNEGSQEKDYETHTAKKTRLSLWRDSGPDDDQRCGHLCKIGRDPASTESDSASARSLTRERQKSP